MATPKPITPPPLTPFHPDVLAFLSAWHENGRAAFVRYTPTQNYDRDQCKVARERGPRWIACASESAGQPLPATKPSFLVDRGNGYVYSTRDYRQVSRPVGTLKGLTRAYRLATEADLQLPPPGYVRADAMLLQASLEAEKASQGESR